MKNAFRQPCRAAVLPLLVCVAAIAATVAAPALARGDQQQRAREHFERGSALVDKGDYETAYREFSRGYSVSDRPLFLFNMAECARKAGWHDKALSHYRDYLKRDPEGRLAETARDRLRQLSAARVQSPAPASALPAADGLADSPLVPLATPPPSSERDHNAGARKDLVAAPAPAEPRRRSVFRRWQVWVAVGAAVAAGSAAIYLGQRGGSPSCGGGCVEVDWRTLRLP